MPKPPEYTGTITLNQVDSPDGLPHYGSWISFTTTTDAPTAWLEMRIEQDGVLVCAGWSNPAVDPNHQFGLTSQVWEAAGGGEADATVTYRAVDQTRRGALKYDLLATLTFHIEA